MAYDLLVAPIGELVPCTPGHDGYHRGWAEAADAVVRQAALAVHAGRIVYSGPYADLPPDIRMDTPSIRIDATDCGVIPGLVDCHTHIPFIGWRQGEIARTHLSDYGTVHAAGGGIPMSVNELAAATDQEVLAFSKKLLFTARQQGALTLEGKSGYGLSVDGELRQLRLLKELAAMVPQTLVPTALPLHGHPSKRSPRLWVDEVIAELIPEIAAQKLAVAVDAFIEPFAYTVDDFDRLAQCARDHGLGIRAHADQVTTQGAVPHALAWGAKSVDHLNYLPETDLVELAASPTAAVLLPGADFLRPTRLPPVMDLLDRGAIVALASNCNPGTSPIASALMAWSLGVHLYRLDPWTALMATTVNAAYVLGLSHEIGSLDIGKQADFLIVDAPVAMMPYRLGGALIQRAFKAGREVLLAPALNPPT